MDAKEYNVCKPEFGLEDAEHVLASLSLASIRMGEYMVIMKPNFDVFIFDEPFLAAMLLFHTRSGDFLGRVWNRTVSRGRAVHLEDFEDACMNHFCSGRLCLGFPQDEEATKPFLVSQTPIPRKYSRVCLERLGEEDANACRECLKMCDGNVECGDEEIPPTQLDLPTPNPAASSEVVKIEGEPELSLPVPEVPVSQIDYVGLSGKLLGEQEELELTANPECVEVVHTAQPGVVGEGVLSVRIHAEGRAYSFGPVNVRTEDEVQLLRALLKDRYETANHSHKKGHLVLPQYYSSAERAKSVLHPDVVNYVSHIFSRKAMKEHKNGRRRNAYTKRSQVIKVDPITGEKIYPPGHPLHGSSDVKPAGNDEKLGKGDDLVSSTNHPNGDTKTINSPWSCAEKCAGVKKRKRSHSGSNGDDYEHVEVPLRICKDQRSTAAASKSVSDKDNDVEDQPPTGSQKGQGRGRRSTFCGKCDGCFKKDDCGECLFCKDKTKFGGPNKLRKKCAERVCGNKSQKGSQIKKAKKPKRAAPDPDFTVDEASGEGEASGNCALGDVSLQEKSWRTTKNNNALRTYARQESKRRGTVEI